MILSKWDKAKSKNDVLRLSVPNEETMFTIAGLQIDLEG